MKVALPLLSVIANRSQKPARIATQRNASKRIAWRANPTVVEVVVVVAGACLGSLGHACQLANMLYDRPWPSAIQLWLS